ncbi:5-carboxymethyl-2-hydroxymuconate Delta-isomerase [Hydrogenophaga intermedia]|jgi:5-carboxymethyl-2-hydroxymuconate isomerase|uniref:5-carboxymethyl-2-hydroxymuconate Delta-isomerase n=1 Tax=Hydrogenophaga intermedia TaxID=65786 RepID=UPI0020433CA7|nr:5-carboxymethyl-2-hydroxymuconate Delta-isomerase [Hydrogenophaga intermedia]MCM3563641.1 5-carboxymethyl-2-hydroxymuconate Delta-isomerase [Hydrogenophaga intermedia]
MPHLVILYSGNLDHPPAMGGTDMGALCRRLCDALLTVRDEQDRQVFPTGGTRVLAFPAAHWAIADGGAAGEAAGRGGDYAFVYLNLRMAQGRSAEVHRRTGETMEAVCKAHFATHLATRAIGITTQVDEGHEVFDAKNSSIHPLFAPPAKA